MCLEKRYRNCCGICHRLSPQRKDPLIKCTRCAPNYNHCGTVMVPDVGTRYKNCYYCRGKRARGQIAHDREDQTPRRGHGTPLRALAPRNGTQEPPEGALEASQRASDPPPTPPQPDWHTSIYQGRVNQAEERARADRIAARADFEASAQDLWQRCIYQGRLDHAAEWVQEEQDAALAVLQRENPEAAWAVMGRRERERALRRRISR